MPLQNRVTPFGEIVAVPERGLFMGNRGRLHNDARQIIRQYRRSYKTWVSCQIDFNGRRRVLMTPLKYTELFFLDEATALSAGHRPCGECRRSSYRQFKAAWIAGNPGDDRGAVPSIRQIDSVLQSDRLSPEGMQRTFRGVASELPEGVFVRRDDNTAAFLLWRGQLHRWTAGGYERQPPAHPDEAVDVLTPRSIVQALRHGYAPVVHSSVD